MTLERIPQLPYPEGITGEVGEYLKRLRNALQEHIVMRPQDFKDFNTTLDHGTLVGLADDDHIQYHNDTRGDARYYVQATVDAWKLDDWASPDDNTDLNASTSAHGLLKKLPNDANKVLDGTGSWVDMRQNVFTSIVTGSHTGDTNWQTLVDLSGSGDALIMLGISDGRDLEVKVTVDGTLLDLGDFTGFETYNYKVGTIAFPTSYTTSLKIEVRTSDGTDTFYYKVLYS